MIRNPIFTKAVLSLVTFSMVLGASPAFALSGSVIYSPTSGDMITRARTTPALTPELNQTYQRTMRTAMTRAAAVKAAVGLIRGLQVISTVAVLVTLASDVKGIWTKNADGSNDFTVPKKVSSCTPNVSDCTMAQYPFRTYKLMPYQGTGCAYGSYDDTNPPNPPTFTGFWCPGVPNTTILPPEKLTDAELGDLIKADSPFIPLLKQLDDLGSPVVFPEPEVEDMPQPIAIQPTTTTHPDGSKTVEKTTLEPYRAPDNSVQWRKKTDVTEISKPDANGQTTSSTTSSSVEKPGSSSDVKPPEAPANDTALPAQPKLYTKKYPDGMTGVWRDQRSAMANSPLFTLPRMLMPSSVGSGGSCPAMNVNLTFSQWANFGTKDIAPPCYVWDWGKAICIVSACLLARRLIFGG